MGWIILILVVIVIIAAVFRHLRQTRWSNFLCQVREKFIVGEQTSLIVSDGIINTIRLSAAAFILLVQFCTISCSTLQRKDNSIEVQQKGTPEIIVGYNSLEAGAGITSQEINAIDRYLLSALTASNNIHISASITKKILYGSVQRVENHYLIIIYISEFPEGKLLNSYSETFLSLLEYRFIVEKLVAKIEGTALIDDPTSRLFRLKPTIPVPSFDIKQALKPISYIPISMDIATDDKYSNTHIERLASIVHQEMSHLINLFNSGEYQVAYIKTINFMKQFSNLIQDAQEELKHYLENAQYLLTHIYQRNYLVSLQKKLLTYSWDTASAKDQADFLGMHLTDILESETEWIDQHIRDDLVDRLINLRDQALLNLQLEQLVLSVELVESFGIDRALTEFAVIFESFIQMKMILEPTLKTIQSVFSQYYSYLINYQLSTLIKKYNIYIEAYDFDAAYFVVEEIEDVLANLLIDSNVNYTRKEISQLKLDTYKICKSFAKSTYEEFVYNVNFFSFHGDAEALNKAFKEYNSYAKKSIFSKNYYSDYLIVYRDIIKKFPSLQATTPKWALDYESIQARELAAREKERQKEADAREAARQELVAREKERQKEADARKAARQERIEIWVSSVGEKMKKLSDFLLLVLISLIGVIFGY